MIITVLLKKGRLLSYLSYISQIGPFINRQVKKSSFNVN